VTCPPVLTVRDQQDAAVWGRMSFG
jgi:hypothetical protein